MNKTEAAAFLDCSVRQLERYTKDNRIGVRMEKGRTRPTPVYDENELAEFKAELERVVHRPAVERMQGTLENAITTQSDGALSLLSQASQLESFARFIVESVKAETNANDAAPSLSDIAVKLLLTLSEAQLLTGLSRNTLRDAIESGDLKAKQIGRGFKVKRSDLESYIEKL